MDATRQPPGHGPERRVALLEWLLAGESAMLAELAQVAGVNPPERLAQEPLALFGRVAAFVDGIDPGAATEDARIWLLNRLGLYLARWFIARHGGVLAVQGDPAQRFYLHFVVGGMDPPVQPGACLDPFAIAADAVDAGPRPGLAALAAAAEAALHGHTPPQR